jgi:hypothetical protein
MNYKRIIGGGLVAGVFIAAAESLLSVLFISHRFEAELGALGIKLQMTPASGIFFSLWGPILGIVSVWLYAAVRPRLGPGPRTAVKVALVVWLLTGVLKHLADAALGIFSLQMGLAYIAIQLFWQIAATLLGAWIYREPGTATATATAPAA